MWHKRAIKTNDKLHWNAYRHFRQEVKREIRLAEKEHVRSEILKSNGNTNSIWKILNRYIPRKNTPLATVENSMKFMQMYVQWQLWNLQSLPRNTILAFMTQRDLIRANLIATRVQTILHYLHFNPSLPSNKAPGCDKFNNAKILKDSSPVIAPIITSLINNSFTLSTFPLPWKKADLSYKFFRLQQIILFFDGMEQEERARRTLENFS